MENANSSPIRALMARCVESAWITPAQADAIASCVEVGYDGAPDDVAEVLMPLVGISAKGDPTEALWGKTMAGAPGGGLVLTDAGFSVAAADPTPPVPRWKAEFPSYGDHLGIKVPHGWEDVSSSRDACPSFQLETQDGMASFRLFIDYADDADARYSRFRLIAIVAGVLGMIQRVVYETDDPRAMSAFCALVALRDEVLDWQSALGGEREGLDELCSACDAIIGEGIGS